MSTIEALIDNTIPAFEGMAQYAAIVGENPSAGARSPLLWNAAFEALGKSCQMVAMDVDSERLAALLEVLEADARFIGGAVAVPHKEAIARWLLDQGAGRLSPEAAAIGAVNCLYRDSEGALCATNTDGEGALVSVRNQRGDLGGARVVLIGPGGAGKAVAAFLGRAIGEAGRLTISARRPQAVTDFAGRLGAAAVAWPPAPELFDDCDIVVNCTSIGSKDLADYTPLSSLDDQNQASSERVLDRLPDGALVFDIIYDPAPTTLLRLAEQRGRATLDGSAMNLEQAVLGFQHAAGAPDSAQVVRDAMQKAKAAL